MICDAAMVEEHARLYREGADAVFGNIPLHEDSPTGFLTETIATAAVWQRTTPPNAFDICGGQLSVTKEVFEALGGFDEEFCSEGKYGDEDVEFAARLVERYDVRHNPQAISQQINLVSAGDFMRRSRQLAVADVRLIAKHPQLTRGLMERRGISLRRTRGLYWPLSAIPLLPRLLAGIVVQVSDAALATRFRSSAVLARLFFDRARFPIGPSCKQVGDQSRAAAFAALASNRA